MINLDEDSFICDMAETYQIYDYTQLPRKQVAVFASGLRDDSRIKMKMSNQMVPFVTMLMAGITDKLSALLYRGTKDHEMGRNKPQLIVELLTPGLIKQESNSVSFTNGRDFEIARQAIIGGEDIGN